MSSQFSQEEGEILVHLARNAVEQYLKNKGRKNIPGDIPEKLLQPSGAFVTINSTEKGQKELRGCIGYPYPTAPLAQAVIDSAISAATQDPRFEPLATEELDNIVFEISILTPPERIEVRNPREYTRKIRIGTDGLIVERGPYKGLLLPQVPVEWGWNEEDFLCQCSLKAGQPPDCWLMKDAKIYKFQAVIFREEKPKGEVKAEVLVGR